MSVSVSLEKSRNVKKSGHLEPEVSIVERVKFSLILKGQFCRFISGLSGLDFERTIL